MQRLLYFKILIILGIVCQLFGCSEDAEVDITEETGSIPLETLKPEVIAVKPTPEMIFDQLQNEFAGRLNNQGDFTGLREATASEIYLNFLSRSHPTKLRVKSLEEYFQIASADKKKYTPFLKKWTGNPTEEEIAFIHQITVAYREVNFIFFNVHHEKQQGAVNIGPLQKKMEIIASLETEEFRHRHQIPLVVFAKAVDEFVLETEKVDAVWLHEQIKEHGIDFGLLWTALYKPALMGEILHNFSSTDLFLKWVDETRLKQK